MALPRWWSLWLRVAAASCASVAALALFFLLREPAELGRSLAITAGLAQAVVAVVTIGLTWLGMASVRRLQVRLDAGADPERLPREDVVSALMLPWRTFFLVWIMYGLFALTFIAVARAVPVLQQTVTRVVPGAIAFGFIMGANQLHLVGNLWRTRVAPVLAPRGRIDHLADEHGNVPHAFVWQHMVLLLGSLLVAWPIVLWALVGDAAPVPASARVVLGLMIFVLTGFHAGAIMRIVARGAGHLAERMELVRKGDLEVRAEVRALDTFGLLSSDFNRMVDGLKQREQLKETFGRYVTHQVAEEILAGRVALGGELKTATVLFSDIRGFTRMSENMSPQEVVAFLNEYLSAMVDCVLEHGGVLDKFIGDAVMAVFGAPVSKGTAEDARAAVACAVAMGERLAQMNEERAAHGLERIEIGIGVHTGELVAGNIGSPKRMEYTVIGDTVNVGSRLESLTKEHKRRTLMSAATAALVREHFAVVEVGTVSVRGRSEQLSVFALENA